MYDIDITKPCKGLKVYDPFVFSVLYTYRYYSFSLYVMLPGALICWLAPWVQRAYAKLLGCAVVVLVVATFFIHVL